MTVPTMPSAGEVEADHQRRAAKQQQWETERVQAIQDEQMAQVHERNLRFGLEDLDTLEADFTARLEQLRERVILAGTPSDIYHLRAAGNAARPHPARADRSAPT